ncbi:MAG: 50S ribosomal protein L6, partial [Candidatus Cloacimonadaceae bacterium]|nr:50S ribosomal protein L6 [Candidatus Cloacimonadaceae bacterium]
MSRIGKAPIKIPAGVTLKTDGPLVTVTGALGELKYELLDGITISEDDGIVTVSRIDESRKMRAFH